MFENFHNSALTDPRMLARMTVRERAIVEGRLPCKDECVEDWFWNDILMPQSETVLTVGWDGGMPGHGGAIWHQCWRGIFYATSSDMDPQGPYDTLDEAMDCYGSELTESNEVYSDVLPEHELIAFVARHAAPDIYGITINDRPYVLRDGLLVPEELGPA